MRQPKTTLGPITEQQLPSLLVGFHGDMRNVQGGEIRKLKPFRLALHGGRRAGGKDHDDGIIKRAIAIADNVGQGPFFPALEYLYAARRSFDMGLYSLRPYWRRVQRSSYSWSVCYSASSWRRARHKSE